jgi:hypothetical protein
VADDSLGAGSLGSAGSDGDADGVGDGEDEGAVGVGTGGSHLHSGLVGLFVRVGPGAPRTGVVADNGGGTAVAGVVPAGAGTAPATAGAAVVVVRGAGAAGPSPIRAFEVTDGRSGKASAAAGRSVTTEPSPFTTPTYAPPAPTTVSSPNAVTARARRGARPGTCPVGGSSAGGTPPNVLIPVDVMSGPSAGGGTGCRPRS